MRKRQFLFTAAASERPVCDLTVSTDRSEGAQETAMIVCYKQDAPKELRFTVDLIKDEHAQR